MLNPVGCLFIRSGIRVAYSLVCIAVLVGQGPEVHAQVVSRWIGDDGNWSDSANWDNGVPAGDAVAIIESGAGEIVQDINVLLLERLELNSSTANIILQNDISIFDLAWDNGRVSGDGSVVLLGEGEINGGSLDATFDNFGSVQFGVNGEFVRLESQIGGVWNNRGGSTATSQSGVLFGSFVAQNIGQVNIESGSIFTTTTAGTTLQSAWIFNNQGIVRQQSSFAFFFDDYFQSNDAQLILEDSGVDFIRDSEVGGLIQGEGSVANLDDLLGAELLPGGSEIGRLAFAGPLVMTPDSESNFQIGPDFTSDQILNSGGPLQLNGMLNIEALPGATVGEYVLFTFNNPSNLQIDDIQFGNVPTGFEGHLQLCLGTQTVKLMVETLDPIVLIGDINGDGIVNLLDVAPFVAILADGQFQAEADVNGDGAVNLLDVAGFVELLVDP